MTPLKMNAKAREFLSIAMASGCAVAVAHDAGATTVTGGVNGVPSGFGSEYSSAYVLPVGTTEVIGTIGAEGNDAFEFQGLSAGDMFTLDVTDTPMNSSEYDVDGDVYNSSFSYITSNSSSHGALLSLSGTVPGDGEIIVTLNSEGLDGPPGGAYFTAQLTTQLGGVPEPEAWALMIAGGMATGAMLRRKRRLTLKAAESAA